MSHPDIPQSLDEAMFIAECEAMILRAAEAYFNAYGTDDAYRENLVAMVDSAAIACQRRADAT